jgi:hypothetical protein
MKTLRLNPAVAGLLLLVLVTAGCEHKKPVLVMPQQTPPPAATPQATPTPAEAEAPAQQPPQAQPTATPAEQPKTAEKTKTKHPRPAGTKKPSGDKGEVAHNNPPKKIIPAEPAPTPPQTGQISPGPTSADAGNSQTSTDQLLQGAEANLNGITRTLTKDEEAMRAQIREFIKQSRNATTENDPARAHTLAMKARLLSDELVKQR